MWSTRTRTTCATRCDKHITSAQHFLQRGMWWRQVSDQWGYWKRPESHHQANLTTLWGGAKMKSSLKADKKHWIDVIDESVGVFGVVGFCLPYMFLREAGYSIAIALIDNTPEVAKQRALSRFMKEGRYASDSYIEAPECSAKHQAPAVALTIDSNIVKSCQCEISEHGEHDEHPCSPPFRTCRKITPNWKRWSRPWCFECPLWCSLWCPLCNSPASASFRSKKPTIATTIALNPLRENAWSAGLTRARGPRGFWLPRSCSFHHSSDTSCNKSRKGQNNQLVSFSYQRTLLPATGMSSIL